VQVQLNRAIDRQKPCHGGLVEICAGRGPHAYALSCATCGQFCGWLSKAAANFIAETIRKFGAPSEPLKWGDATHDNELTRQTVGSARRASRRITAKGQKS
jgi:hypothetical protein